MDKNVKNDIPVQGAEVVREKTERKLNPISELKRWAPYITKFEEAKMMDEADIQTLKEILKRAVQRNVSLGIEI